MKESQKEQDDANHPVELAGAFVGGRVEHADHVEKDYEDHGVRGPAMQIAQERTHEDDELQVLHVLVRAIGIGVVIEHQGDASARQDDEEEEGDEPEIESVANFQVFLDHLDGMDVQPEAVEDQLCFSLVGTDGFAAEDGAVDVPEDVHAGMTNR